VSARQSEDSPRTGDRAAVVDMEVNAAVDLVWQALREPTEIRRWFGWDYPGLEKEIEQIFVAGAEVTQPGRALQLIGADTTLSVSPSAGGSRLQLTMPAPGWPEAFDEIAEGWTSFALQLRLALERHRGADRRTLQHSAPVEGAEASPPDAIPGPGGSSGSLCFRNQHQRAWLIPAWGDGLLIATRTPPRPDAPHGKWSLLITTYGMTAAEFDTLRSRWTSWNTSPG
jgi:uncharacterized protein YndB with AHSA1/START domain